MDDAHFDLLAETTLTKLVTALDRIEGIDAELSQGVLTISFEAGGAPFVVNSHRAAKQIWMAAGRTAWHFDPDASGARWTSAKEPKDDLFGALSAALSAKVGAAISLG